MYEGVATGMVADDEVAQQGLSPPPKPFHRHHLGDVLRVHEDIGRVRIDIVAVGLCTRASRTPMVA